MFPHSPPGLPPLFFPPLDPMVNMSRSGSAPVPISYIGNLCDIFSGQKGVSACSTGSGMSTGKALFFVIGLWKIFDTGFKPRIQS